MVAKRLTNDFADWMAPPAPNGKDTLQILSQPKGDLNFPRLISALECIEPHDWQTWITVGLALKNESNDLFSVWQWWSKRSPKSQGCDLHTEWDNLSPDGRVTLGTIFHLGGKVEESARFETYTLDHLLNGDFRVTYLIEGILVAGQPCLCVGPQKTLKTTLLLYMALCLSMGNPFLGKSCKKSRVLFMSGESGMATLQETAQRMIASFGGEYDSETFHLSPNLPRFDQPIDELKTLLSELKTEVLIIDPAYLCLAGADAGNMFVMGQQLKSVADLCTALNITLVLAHHSTKAAGKEHKPLELADMAWAGFGEFARQWLMLSRRESYVDGTGEHKLYLRAGGSAGHSNLLNLDISEGVYPERHWDIQFDTAGNVAVEKRERQYQADVARVVEILQDGPLVKSRIKAIAGINTHRWPTTFDRFLVEGVIVPTQGKGHVKYETPGATK